MQVPLEISYRDVIKTDELDNLIREKVNKLEKICDHITSCHITVERPQKNLNYGSPFRVRIDLRIPPGHEVVIKREPGEGEMEDSIYMVVKKTFEAAKRKVQRIVELQRKEIKSHPAQEKVAIVSQLFQDEGYGFIKTPNGRDIYFHQNSVLHHDFKNLKPGIGVRFFEEDGDNGPQASTVQIVDSSQAGT